MPTYLVHGFRWPRHLVRIHIIQNDIEDAAPEWLMAPATSAALLNSFYTLFDFLPPSNPPRGTYPLDPPSQSPVREPEPAQPPRRLSKKNTSSRQSLKAALSLRKGRPADVTTAPKNNGANGSHSPVSGHGTSPSSSSASTTIPQNPFNTWSIIKLLEQYNPLDLSVASQPHAYVGDYILPISLGISVADEINKYEDMKRAEEIAIADPADGVSEREVRRRSRRFGWFEKLRDGLSTGPGGAVGDIGWFVVVCGDEERRIDAGDLESSEGEGELSDMARTPKSAGLRGFFGRKEKKEVDE